MLTKFDIIDDKVDSAISMIYISRQPIVFVGTGQTYTEQDQLLRFAEDRILLF